jgi:hypothetical protein
MVEAGTLCTNANVEFFTGAKGSATADAEAFTNVSIKMAEGFVCTASRYDWVTNYASVSLVGKELLRNATAAWAAIIGINYDQSGYTSKEESQCMIDVCWSMVVETINLLRDDKYREFVLNG